MFIITNKYQKRKFNSKDLVRARATIIHEKPLYSAQLKPHSPTWRCTKSSTGDYHQRQPLANPFSTHKNHYITEGAMGIYKIASFDRKKNRINWHLQPLMTVIMITILELTHLSNHHTVRCMPDLIRIGALFGKSNFEQEDIFIKTIQMMNNGSGFFSSWPFFNQQQQHLRQPKTDDFRPVQPATLMPANDSNLHLYKELNRAKRTKGKLFIYNDDDLDDQTRDQQQMIEQQQQSSPISGVRPIIEPLVELLVNRDSSYEADERACKLLLSGVVAIFGPIDGSSRQHVQSICDTLEIPHLEMHPDYVSKQQDLTINFYPPAQLLTAAYIELFNAWNWTSFAIVYEHSDSMIRLQSLFRESSGTWTSKWSIRLFQYYSSLSAESSKNSTGRASQTVASGHQTQAADDDETVLSDQDSPSSSSNDANDGSDNEPSNDAFKRNNQVNKQEQRTTSFRELFWKLKQSGETNILLDVKDENLYTALKHAQQVGCMTEKYSYLIASLDLHMIDLEDFKHSKTLITAFKLVRDLHETPPSMTGDFNNDLSSSVPTNGQSPSYHHQHNVHQQQQGNFVKLKYDSGYFEKLGFPAEVESSIDQQHLPNESAQLQQVLSDSSNYYNAHAYDDELSPSSKGQTSGRYGERTTTTTTNEYNLNGADSEQADSLLKKALDAYLWQQQKKLAKSDTNRLKLSTSSALIHDALLLLLMGLTDLDTGQTVDVQPISCDSKDAQPWLYGSSIVNYMRRITFSGLSGLVSFDERGLRTGFTLDVMSVAPSVGLIKIGEWHSSSYITSLRGHVATAARQHLLRPNSQLVVQPIIGGAAISLMNTSKQVSKATVGEVQFAELNAHRRSKESSMNGNKRISAAIKDAAKLLVEPLEEAHEQPVATEGPTQTVHSWPPVKTPTVTNNQWFEPKFNSPKSSSKALVVNEELYQRIYLDNSDDMETLIVTTRRTQPYFMLKETPNKQEGNNQYEGFAVDLIHELSKLVGFKYRFKEVDDGKYGAKIKHKNGTQSWNGMIGEIISGKADLAIVDLTITSQREEAVDFTLPFMNTGISILFKKPTTKQNTLFSFLSPFSADVWAYVVAAYASISALLFFVGRLSPYEWANPHPCRQDLYDSNEIVMRNNFSLMNSFWFTTGSLMQQGSDLTPRSMSTRTIAGIWYFFTLIMISSYTANLAAFLTVEKVVFPIENAKDLSLQQEIRYGCMESGSTCTFFSDSHIDTYKRIGQTMEKYKTYVKSQDEGRERVQEGKFAFFMESTSIEYITERDCNLTQIGGLLDSKGYGVATSKKPTRKRPYRTLLSEGILHLQENGVLHILKNRWWKERRGGGTCTDEKGGSGVTELSLGNVGGVFVVLLGGLGLSFLFAIAEFVWKSRKTSTNRDSMCEEMIKDLKFALACQSSTKPAIKKIKRPVLSATQLQECKDDHRCSSFQASFLQSRTTIINEEAADCSCDGHRSTTIARAAHFTNDEPLMMTEAQDESQYRTNHLLRYQLQHLAGQHQRPQLDQNQRHHYHQLPQTTLQHQCSTFESDTRLKPHPHL